MGRIGSFLRVLETSACLVLLAIPPEIAIAKGPCFGKGGVVPEPRLPDSPFDFIIRRLRFRSLGTSYAIDGSLGRLAATTLDLTHPLMIRATVTINGEPVELAGKGSPDTFMVFTTDRHPTFSGVRVSGRGYEITLSAVPEL